MILTRIGVIASSGVTSESFQVGVTRNYATISGSTSQEEDALVEFTNDLVDANIYDKFVAFYPFTGSDVNHKVFNLVNPLDQDGSFRLKLLNSPVSNVKGITLNGTTQKLCTFIDPNLITTRDFIGTSWYIQTAQSNRFITLYDSNGANENAGFNIQPRFTDGKAYSSIWCSALGTVVPATVAGFHMSQRVSGASNQLEFTELSTDYVETRAINNNVTNDKLLTMYGNGNFVVSAWGVHRAFTPTEKAAYKTALDKLMLALNRNV